MDFYRMKAILNSNVKTFLVERQEGRGETWAEFVRKQTLSLGVSEKLCLKALETIEPRLTIKDGEIVKNE